jgi:hypothetical protein
VIRLWPDAERGAFSGTVVAPRQEGISRVDVIATTGTTRAIGTAPLAVRADRGSAGTRGPLNSREARRTLAATHHGVDIAATDLATLDRWLRETAAPPSVRAIHHPMRSPWWIVPFVACLSIDWWITSSRKRRR